MFPTLRLPNSTLWEVGPYPGVEFAALSYDPASGARFLLRKFAPGATIPAHRHPLTSESVIILKGKWIEEKVEYGPGAFLYAPKNSVHGPHFAEKEVISVTWYDGPLTVENVHPTDPTPSSLPSVT